MLPVLYRHAIYTNKKYSIHHIMLLDLYRHAIYTYKKYSIHYIMLPALYNHAIYTGKQYTVSFYKLEDKQISRTKPSLYHIIINIHTGEPKQLLPKI